MSTEVALSELETAMRDYGSGYLLSVDDEGHVKVIAASVRCDGETVRVDGPSRGTSANVARNPLVTLLFPACEEHGMSLIVDATALDTGDGYTLTPTHAVLHRPSAHAGPGFEAGEECGNDCRPL